MMTFKWETHRGDEWWYSDNACEADGWFSTAYPTHLEISLNKMNDHFTEQSIYQFLLMTQNQFPNCQLWLILNMKIKQLITILKDQEKLDWKIINNPLSESARITYIA